MMIMILVIFLLSGLVEHASTIKCYTCTNKDAGYHCTLPLNFDGGDESDENTVSEGHYNPGYACLSEQSLNPRTGQQKVILRGIEHCKELNKPNHRIHCCYTNNCNEILPKMLVKSVADFMSNENTKGNQTVTGNPTVKAIESNSQWHLSSIIFIAFSIICQYIFFKL